jgi:hypothetical protein
MTESTVLPIDCISLNPSIAITPMLISNTGYLYGGQRTYLKDPSLFRSIDIGAENGQIVSIECTNDSIYTPPLCDDHTTDTELPTQLAIECLGQIFIQKDAIVRVLNRYADFAMNSPCNTVTAINGYMNPTMTQFMDTVNTNELCTIQWSDGEMEQFTRKLRSEVDYGGDRVSEYITVWNSPSLVVPDVVDEPPPAVVVTETNLFLDPCESFD